MSVTVLVTQARFSFPGGRPLVTPARFLVSSFQFSIDINPPLFEFFQFDGFSIVSPAHTACLGERYAGLLAFSRLTAGLCFDCFVSSSSNTNCIKTSSGASLSSACERK